MPKFLTEKEEFEARLLDALVRRHLTLHARPVQGEAYDTACRDYEQAFEEAYAAGYGFLEIPDEDVNEAIKEVYSGLN